MFLHLPSAHTSSDSSELKDDVKIHYSVFLKDGAEPKGTVLNIALSY